MNKRFLFRVSFLFTLVILLLAQAAYAEGSEDPNNLDPQSKQELDALQKNWDPDNPDPETLRKVAEIYRRNGYNQVADMYEADANELAGGQGTKTGQGTQNEPSTMPDQGNPSDPSTMSDQGTGTEPSTMPNQGTQPDQSNPSGGDAANDPNTAEGNKKLAEEAFASGDYENAENYLKNAIGLDPSDKEAYESLMQYYFSSGQTEKANEVYNEMQSHAQ